MLFLELLFPRWCWSCVCVLMFPAAVQDSQPNTPTTTPDAVSSNISERLTPNRQLPQDNNRLSSLPVELTEDVINEINAIRNRLGGGVASRLEGLMPSHQESPFSNNLADSSNSPTKFQNRYQQRPLEGEFERQLRALAGPASQAKQSVSSVDLNENRRDHDQDLFAQHLRTAARYLDLAAAELEEVSQYDAADELRQQAQQMRLKARSTLPR